MLNLLAVAALLALGPSSTPAADGTLGLATQPASHTAQRLTPKQKAWFEQAVGDILRERAASARRGVDVSLPR